MNEVTNNQQTNISTEENILKEKMSVLLKKCYEEEKDYKKIIAEAVNLGINFEKNKIHKQLNNIIK